MVEIHRWTLAEFNVLLQNPRISDNEMTRILTNKSVGAVGVVRSFIHNYHQCGDISGLSKLMIERLKQKSWLCSRCQFKC